MLISLSSIGNFWDVMRPVNDLKSASNCDLRRRRPLRLLYHMEGVNLLHCALTAVANIFSEHALKSGFSNDSCHPSSSNTSPSTSYYTLFPLSYLNIGSAK